jgi:hypothetical protein
MKAYKHEVTMTEETRLALLEQSIEHISETLHRLDKRFDKLESKIDEVQLKAYVQFRWLIGALLTLIGTIVTTLIKGHGG